MICGSGGSKSRLAKIARRCGAKHISKSKCTKHLSFGVFLEVAMSKKRTPLWREAHFQVKMLKTLGVRTTFGRCDVEKVHAVVARSTFRSENVQNTPMFGPLLEVQMSLRVAGARDCASCQSEQNVRVLLHFQLQPPLHHTTLQYITLHYNYNYTFTTFYYTPLHYTALNYTQLHYTTLHYTTLQYTTLHYTTRHYLPLHFTTLHYTTLHNTTTTTTQLHSTTLNYTTLHYITLHSTRLHYTTLHYTTLHYTTLHYTE